MKTEETNKVNSIEQLLAGNIADLLQKAVTTGAIQKSGTAHAQETDDSGCSMDCGESVDDCPNEPNESTDCENQTMDDCQSDPSRCDSGDCPSSSGNCTSEYSCEE